MEKVSNSVRRHRMDTYALAASQVLMDFQFIEEALRMYIASAFNVIRTSTQDKVPFKFDRSSVEKDSLGKLIGKYSKLSDNQKLIADLNRVVEDRNLIAHRSLLLTPEEQEPSALAVESSKLENLHDVLHPMLLEIMEEVRKIEMHLSPAA